MASYADLDVMTEIRLPGYPEISLSRRLHAGAGVFFL